MKSKNIDRTINSIAELPTLPTIYMKLSRILNVQNSSIRMISNIISEDLAVSAVLATSMYKTIKQLKSSSAFDIQEFWKHSIGCAILAKVLAETAYIKNPEDVFTGGLLHDIGKLIHFTYLREEFEGVVANVVETGSQMFESEKKILGFDHTQTGSALAKKWCLPRKTINMIANHHLSDTPDTLTKEVAAVHIGNILCISLRMGSGGEKRVPIINQKAWKILDLKLSDLEYIMQRSTKLFEESISNMELN
ncbi:MAG: HDOD domain-containing protein [Deltaproteobacteria bacterium]|nr:HDOD domain-containing protein [Deltaproteobacteria bacterium]